jgi:D-glycerate 3-kinase
VSQLWPENLQCPGHEQQKILHQQLLPAFKQLLAEEKIPADRDMMSLYHDLYLPFSAWLAAQHKDRPVIVGINGAQGSGKSTLTRIVQMLLEKAYAKNIIALSIDDLYKTRQQRQQMADSIHPLFNTRGVPGTHDIDMATELFDKLRTSGAVGDILLPRFNKAIDDRYPQGEWSNVRLPVDIILFEGWCVGSIAEDEASLVVPINSLEAEEDADGIWREYVNKQLSGPYQQLFSSIDILVMLQIPDMKHVYEWRSLQEQKLQSSHSARPVKNNKHIMSEADIARFIMHYERITRSTLTEMPSRADIVMKLDENHLVSEVVARDR